MITHATIVPLIGGATIGQSLALGKDPEWMASYSPFASNDSHVRNYYPNVPYHILDKGDKPTKQVDIINTVCPCAGLSKLSATSSGDSEINNWLYHTTRFGLSMNPKMMWGENAPYLIGKKGEVVRDNLKVIANSYGYDLYYFKMNAIDHGLAQNRGRAHYLFTKLPPPMSIKTRDEVDVADLIESVKGHNEKYPDHNHSITMSGISKPSKDIFYRFTKEKRPDLDTYCNKSARILMTNKTRHHWNGDLQDFAAGKDMFIGKATAIDYINKFKEQIIGGSTTFYKGTVFSCGKVIPPVIDGQRSIAHPHEDRFLNHRELMTLMGLPMDFELVNPLRNENHISQNVPVNVAEDFVKSLVG